MYVFVSPRQAIRTENSEFRVYFSRGNVYIYVHVTVNIFLSSARSVYAATLSSFLGYFFEVIACLLPYPVQTAGGFISMKEEE